MPTSPPQEAEESYEDEYKIAPPWMMEVKVERVKPPPPLQVSLPDQTAMNLKVFSFDLVGEPSTLV